jgi:hypothetical protein
MVFVVIAGVLNDIRMVLVSFEGFSVSVQL